MAVKDQTITEQYALYNGDSCEVLKNLPGNSVDLTIFSPPFADLYCYSDNPADLGNCRSYAEFFEQFLFIIKELELILNKNSEASIL